MDLLRKQTDLIFFLDEDGSILGFHGPEKSLYARPEHFIGKRPEEVLPPQAGEPIQAQIDSIGKGGEAVGVRYYLRMPDGPRDYEARFCRLPEGTRLLAIVRDLTEHQRLIQALNRKRSQLDKRIKELACLNQVLRLTENDTDPIEEVLARLLPVIMTGIRDSSLIEIQIDWSEELQLATPGFRVTEWMIQAREQTAAGKPLSLTLAYRTAPLDPNAPFLLEEHVLLGALTRRLAEFLDRRHKQRQLAEREGLIQAIFEQMADGLVLIEPASGRLVDFNTAAYRSLGYEAASFTQTRFEELLAAPDPQQLKAILSGALPYLETQYRAKNGKIHEVAIHFSPVQHQGQRLIAAIWHDITSRKRREREQHARIERLRIQDELIRTFSLAPAANAGDIATYACTITGSIAQHFGYAQVSLWLLDEDRDALTCLDRYHAQTGQHTNGLVLRQSGVQTWREILQSYRHFDSHEIHSESHSLSGLQRTLGLTGAGSAFACTILSGTAPRGLLCLVHPDPAHTWYADEIQFACQVAAQFGIALLNREREAFRIFGMPKEIPPTPELVDSYIYPDDRSLVDRAWDEALTGQPYRVTHRIHTPHGIRWVEERAEILCDASGQPVEALGTVQDVTERLELEQQLASYRDHLEDLVAARTAELAAAKSEAESANRTKSVFLSNISHEIRTPLNAILGYIHLIEQEPLSPRQSAWINKLNHAARHLLQIINDILDLSRIEAGALRLDPHDFAPEQLIGRVIDMIAQQAQAKGLDLRIDLSGLPPCLHGDSVRIGQVLLNLLSNAVKFTERGWIELTAHTLGEQEMPPANWWVRWTVRDTGVGMTPEQLQRVFRPFEQTETGIARRYGGTGLGLAICKRLVEQMGGRLEVESQPGLGSTFWFEIPIGKGGDLGQTEVVAPSGIARSGPQAGAPRLTGVRILVAEDNALNQEMIQALLESSGAQVRLVANGQEAVDAVLHEPFDLVLMDVQMPVMDGLAATRSIRAHPQYQALPILAMTANAFASDRRDCLDAGMNDHLTKPIIPARLAEVIARWLPGRVPEPNTTPRPPGSPEHAAWSDLRAIPSLDADQGLAHLQDNLELYRSLLQRFAAALPDEEKRLTAALASGDLETLRQKAHQLKGIAANLGATAIHAQAQKLEQAVRAGRLEDELQGLVKDLNGALRTLGEHFRCLGQVETQNAVQNAVGLESLSAGLDRLANLLSKHDTRANHLFAEYRSALYHAFGQGAERLERAIQSFDYEEALVILQGLLNP
ncbi:response regulator [Caldichromatium japonicum]|uniref:histidine kinase n=1 Tax=Caldichromatium japonicum TaxID=2699430 RepID=A0A6G7VFL4_9GAMM|nr:ATP-binding protein [Caldichromatium japonicum]QIK38638.1 response regulator [Caldichromatium japonicum]